MKALRALAGSLLWVLAGVVGLLGALLSITIVLLPVGIPLLLLARKLFAYSMTFFLPRAVRHPGEELGRKGRDAVKDATKKARKKTGKPGKRGLFGRKRPWYEKLLDGVVHALQ
jgi:hypothetical protein